MRKSWATAEEDTEEDELLLKLVLELETLLDDELLLDDDELLELDDELREDDKELLATLQLGAIFCVTLMMVLLVSFLITIRVQPLVATSDAGKESSPHFPLGSTLKRGPPLSSPWEKLRQFSKVLDEPATGVKRSPSFQALWVPRRWNSVWGADEELLLELELEESTELELLESAELLELELELLDDLLELLTDATTEDDDGGSSGFIELVALLDARELGAALLGTTGALEGAAAELLVTWLELTTDASDDALDEDGVDDEDKDVSD